MMVMGAFEGTTSSFATSIVDYMSEAGISDDYILVSNYQLVLHESSARNCGKKIIYLAFDSESKAYEHRGWREAEHLTSNRPELVIVVSKIAYDFYNNFGLNVYYLPMGYDVQTKPKKKELDISFVGTIDDFRSSIFYYRHILGRMLARVAKKENYHLFFANRILYNKLPEIYSMSVLGVNDAARWVNMRCWEIPVNGAFMLVNPVIRNTDYPLKENKHYMVYEDPLDLIDKIKHLLDDREGTIEMGLKARKEALKYPLKKNIEEMVKKCNLK